MKRLSTKHSALLALAFVLAVAAGALALRSYHGHQQKVEVTQGLDQMNKVLPKMIDSMTRLDSVKTTDGTDVVYHYTIIGPSGAQVQAANLDPMKAAVVASYCSNPQLAVFRQNAMTLKYQYYREDQSKIGELAATPADCTAQAGK